MDAREMQAELERLRTENERLKQSIKGKVSLKVSEKGALFCVWPGAFPRNPL
jgi:hypothetical protein